MNRWVLLALVVLAVGVFVLGQGLALTRDPVGELPEKAPDWLSSDGLGGLLMPFAPKLDPADVQAQNGAGWSYEPTSGRLSIAAGTLASAVALQLPRDPEHGPKAGTKPHQRSRRVIELVAVASADAGGGEVSVRLVDPVDPDAAQFARLENGRMSLAVPPEGAHLELLCLGPRSFLLR